MINIFSVRFRGEGSSLLLSGYFLLVKAKCIYREVWHEKCCNAVFDGGCVGLCRV